MTILPQENYAISMDIGTGKIALGFAKPIDPGMPIEAVTLNSGSNTTVIDSTNLTELLKEAVQNQLPSAEYRAKSNTDTMHEICEAMLTLLREVFQLAEREHPDAFEEKYKDGSHHFVPLFFLLFFFFSLSLLARFPTLHHPTRAVLQALLGDSYLFSC